MSSIYQTLGHEQWVALQELVGAVVGPDVRQARPLVNCSTCRGAGAVIVGSSDEPMRVRCDMCQGKGTVPGEPAVPSDDGHLYGDCPDGRSRCHRHGPVYRALLRKQQDQEHAKAMAEAREILRRERIAENAAKIAKVAAAAAKAPTPQPAPVVEPEPVTTAHCVKCGQEIPDGMRRNSRMHVTRRGAIYTHWHTGPCPTKPQRHDEESPHPLTVKCGEQGNVIPNHKGKVKLRHGERSTATAEELQRAALRRDVEALDARIGSTR